VSKIDFLYDHLQNAVLKNSDLISGIKEINNEISTTDLIQTLKTEKWEARIRDRELSGVARQVSNRFRAKKEEAIRNCPKQRKSRRRREQRVIITLNFKKMSKKESEPP
jgi:hypothetical protein